MEIECDYCGKKFEYKEGKSHYERSENHYCSRSCQGKGNNLKQGNNIHGLAKEGKNGKQSKRYRIWSNVKKRARKNGTNFTLKPSDIPKIPERCPVLGIKIKENDKAGPKDSSPSLDRIKQDKGYISENIRIISNRANRLRQDATKEELKKILKDVEENNV